MSGTELTADDSSILVYIASLARHKDKADREMWRAYNKLDQTYARRVARAIASKAGLDWGKPHPELDLVADGFLAWVGVWILRDPRRKQGRP